MTECPKCHKGKLRVMYGKRFSRYFVSCDAYPECKTIYSLPPKGMMKPARMSKKAAEEAGKEEGALEMCKDCGFPMVAAFKKGGAPWRFCFNMECPSNEEAKKKKEEFKAKMKSGEVEIVDGKIIDHTKEKKVEKKKKTVKKRKKKVEKKK
jgi:ssDNA-binding Zn-finger/Zn-ribbon topoisomerase 1